LLLKGGLKFIIFPSFPIAYCRFFLPNCCQIFFLAVRKFFVSYPCSLHSCNDSSEMLVYYDVRFGVEHCNKLVGMIGINFSPFFFYNMTDFFLYCCQILLLFNPFSCYEFMLLIQVYDYGLCLGNVVQGRV